MDVGKLTLADRIVGGTGVVLLIDLVFFPWHSRDRGILTETHAGIESPNGFWGVLALLLTIALVAALVVIRLGDVESIELPLPFDRTVFAATIAVLLVLVVKLLAEAESLGFGAWLGILLAAGMVYGGYLEDRGTAAR